MTQLPKRSDPIYKEIEEFKDYELTNCIAYEMAIRNYVFLNNIKKSVLEINDYFNNSLEMTRNNDSFCSVLLNFISSAFRDFGLYCISNFDLYKILEIKELNKVEVIQYLKNKKEFTFKKSLSRLGDIESKVHDGYILSQFGKGEEANTIPYQNVVTGNFKRPLLKYFNNQFIELELNLALPEIELCAFIKKIKKDLSLTVLKIDTPSISLGEDLEKSNNKHTQKKPKAEKYADWFYIYDCYKILKADNKKKSNETIYNEIDLLLLEHYNLIDDDYYSTETYKKTIMKNMNYLIDELGYKELITGVKNN